MTRVCPHGFYNHAAAHHINQCAICRHDEGQCDYGTCQEPATTTVETIAHRRIIEHRPMCRRHGGER